MENNQDDQNRQAKIEALRHLRDNGFYEPETDNPEGLPLEGPGNPNDQAQPIGPNPAQQAMPIQPDPRAAQALQPSPDQTMQQNPQNLIDALKRKRDQQLMDSLFPKNGQER